MAVLDFPLTKLLKPKRKVQAAAAVVPAAIMQKLPVKSKYISRQGGLRAFFRLILITVKHQEIPQCAQKWRTAYECDNGKRHSLG